MARRVGRGAVGGGSGEHRAAIVREVTTRKARQAHRGVLDDGNLVWAISVDERGDRGRGEKNGDEQRAVPAARTLAQSALCTHR